MTGASTGSALAHRPLLAPPGDSLTRGCDRVLDAVIIVMASWTLVYHACFLLRVGSTAAIVVEAALLLGISGTALARSRQQADGADADPAWSDDRLADVVPVGPSPERLVRLHPRLGWATGGAALVAGAAMALRVPWFLVWVPWLVAAGCGTALALRALPGSISSETGTHAGAEAVDVEPGPRRRDAIAVLVLGAVLAVLSLVVVRPNPDDLFYVNLSQWIAGHGAFPHRDTIYADLVYPLSNWPPLASYDAGTGALAHLLGVRAATVDYIAVPPVATVLSVLALWRLLRAWRVRHVLIALAAAVIFLMFDGTSSYGSPGNLWFTRLWQGKVILLCVVVPWLLVAGLRYVRNPRRHGAVWLAAGGVAAIACSTTAVFLVPVVAMAVAAPLVVRAPRRAGVLFASMAGYPMAMAVVTKAVGGRSPDDFEARKLYRFDPAWFGHEVFLDGVIALVGVLAVLLGVLVVPNPAARVTTAAAALLTGITFIPGVTHLGYDTVGLGPTLWRLTWSLSVAALVGAVASSVASAVGERGTVRSRQTAWVAAAVVTALVAVFGHPILARDTTTSFALPAHWQRTSDTIDVARWIEAHTQPGDVVLAPDGISITIAVSTTSIKTVTPRDYYMQYLQDDPRFDYDQRLALTYFVNDDGGWRRAQIAPALRSLDVRVACAYRSKPRHLRLLRAAGFVPAFQSATYQCLTARA